ncbi:hypothetical protein Tco_0880211, partial [Tanacetum coccineum]
FDHGSGFVDVKGVTTGSRHQELALGFLGSLTKGYGVDLFCKAACCRIMVCVSRFRRGLDTKESEYGSSYGVRELRNQFWNMVAYIWEKDLQYKGIANASRAKRDAKTHDHVALVANTYANFSSSPSPTAYYVILLMWLIMMKIIERRRNLYIRNGGRYARRSSGNQGESVDNGNVQKETRNGNIQRILQTSATSGNASNVECYNCNAKVGIILTNEQDDFLLANAYEIEELEDLSANICMMARIQQADNDYENEPSYGFAFTSEETSTSLNKFHSLSLAMKVQLSSKTKFHPNSKTPEVSLSLVPPQDAVICVKQKQLNFGVGIERMTFSINFVMKHSYSNDDTCFNIDVIDEILEEDSDALLDEGSKILYSIEGTLLEFDEFMAMNIKENFESESDKEEIPFEKITFDTDYKINQSLDEPPTDLELKPLPDHLEYTFLEEPSFLPVIISSQLSKQNKDKLVFVLKRHKQAFAWKTTKILTNIKFTSRRQETKSYIQSPIAPSLSPDPQRQENFPQAAETVTTSNELDSLFSRMFDELFNGSTPVMSKSSAATAADAPDQRQQQNITTSTLTTIATDTPPLNIQITPEITNQAPTITANENINQAETQKKNT